MLDRGWVWSDDHPDTLLHPEDHGYYVRYDRATDTLSASPALDKALELVIPTRPSLSESYWRKQQGRSPVIGSSSAGALRRGDEGWRTLETYVDGCRTGSARTQSTPLAGSPGGADRDGCPSAADRSCWAGEVADDDRSEVAGDGGRC